MKLKKSFLTTAIPVALLTLFPLPSSAQLIQQNVTFIKSGCMGDPYDYLRPGTRSRDLDTLLEISFSDKHLTAKGQRIICCGGEELNCEIQRSGNIIWLEEKITVADAVTSCLCLMEFSVELNEELPEGDYILITSKGTTEVSLKDGMQLVLTKSDFNTDFIDFSTQTEWVYYNPGIDGNTPHFIRMRLFKDFENRFVNSYDVKYRLDSADFTDADKCGVIYSYKDSYSSIQLNTTLTGEHPSLLIGAHPDWNEMRNFESAYFEMDFCANSFPFYDFSSNETIYPQIYDVRETIVDGKPSLHLFFTNGLELVRGVGPVGDSYTSNFIIPAIEQLPEGTVPTRFLYIRSLEDNRVLYGDATLDPSYSSFSGLQEINDKAWVDDGSEFGITSDTPATVKVMDLSGNCIASQTGTGKVTIERDQFDSGIYIVVCTASGLHLTRKIAI